MEDDGLDTNLLCENSYSYIITVGDQYTPAYSNFSSISCAQLQCWGIKANGSAAFISINQSNYCSWNKPVSHLQSVDEGLVLVSIDTDLSGATAAVEQHSGDLYVRFGISNETQVGSMWTNFPGCTFRDIAVGRDVIYGIDTNGDFLQFSA